MQSATLGLCVALIVSLALVGPAASQAHAASTLRGVVTIQGDGPAVGAAVDLCPAGPDPLPPCETTATDAMGAYVVPVPASAFGHRLTITPVPSTDPYVVINSFFRSFQPPPRGSGLPAVLNVQLTSTVFGLITGVVTDPSGAPIETQVRWALREPLGFSYSEGIPTGPDGTYSLRLPPNPHISAWDPHPYVVSADFPVGTDYAAAVATAVDVATRGTTVVNLALGTAGTITGVVTSAGAPVVDGLVAHFGSASDCPSRCGTFSNVGTRTAADGSYRLSHVPAGEQVLLFSDPATLSGSLGGVASVAVPPGGTVVLNVDFANNDSDEVSASIENGGPNAGDGNHDGVLDSIQTNVITLRAANDPSKYVTLDSLGGNGPYAVETRPTPVTPPEGVVFPVGLIKFFVSTGTGGGGTASVRLHLPAGSRPNAYFVFRNFAWIDATSIATFSGDTLTVTLTDNGTLGDEDGQPFNGSVLLLGAPAHLADADGVPAAVEDAAPNGGDGNGDGILDSIQPNVASLPNALDGRYLTIESPSGTELANVSVLAAPASPAPPAGAQFPVGLVGFSLNVTPPGASATVRILLPSGSAPNAYYKLQNGAWVDVTAQASFGGDVVTLTLVDGGPGDADGSANGVIVDPGAPAHTDRTAPTITGAASPAANASGWNKTPVLVTFTCGDADSGIASCTPPLTFSADGAGQSATGTATDRAGNAASVTLSGINIDRTAPTIQYAGNLGTYTVDQTILVTCQASDALSGLASNTCANVSGAAYTFPLGPNSVAANATDKAGNFTAKSTTFTVMVTPGSLCLLTKQFVQASAKYRAAPPSQQAQANQLLTAVCAKVSAVTPNLTPAQKAAAITAYQKAVDTLVPAGWLTAAQAAILKALASSL